MAKCGARPDSDSSLLRRPFSGSDVTGFPGPVRLIDVGNLRFAGQGYTPEGGGHGSCELA